MFYTSSILKNIYRNCMSNQNLKWIQGILRFFDLLQPNFWDTNFYKKVVFESTDMKLDIGINKSTDGFIFNVNNWQMALVIAWNLSPNFSLSHEYTHCTLRIHSIHARVQNMKNCARVSLCGYDRQAKYCKTDWRGIPIIQISKKGKAGWWSMTFTSWVRL